MLNTMKSWTQNLLLIASVLYSATFALQFIPLLSLFRFQFASEGMGFVYQMPDHLPWVLAALMLNLLALLIAIYMGLAGLRLRRGDLRGLKSASLLALLLPPFGLIAGLLGLLYLRSVRRGG